MFCIACKRKNHDVSDCFFVKRVQNEQASPQTAKTSTMHCLACNKTNHSLAQCFFVKKLQKDLQGGNPRQNYENETNPNFPQTAGHSQGTKN